MLNKFNQFKIGGNRDTVCLSLMLSPLIGQMPLFYSPLNSILYPAMGILGAIGVSYRVLDNYRNSSLINSSTNFISSEAHAKFQKNKDLLVGYTTDKGIPIGLYSEIMTRHISIVGQSGTGKSVFNRSILFQHILTGGGMLHVDGKNDDGDFLKFYNLAKSIGRGDDVLVIDFDNPDVSNTYNPILYGDPDEVATRIVSLIPFSEGSPGADHYRSEATIALTTFVAALQKAGLAYSMIDLSLLLMSDKALIELDEKLTSIDEFAEETINFKTFLSKCIKKGKIDTIYLKSMFGGVGGRIFQLGTGKFGKITSTYNPDVNLFDIITKNKILWVKLPTLGKTEAANAFGKILVSDLRTAVSWVLKLPDNQKPSPLFLASMDEAGSYVNDSWGRLFEQARSARIVMMPAVQTHANYLKVSDELLSIVEGNTWNKVYFKVGDLDTAKRVVETLGKTKTIKYTLTQTENSSESRQNLQMAPNSNIAAGAGQNFGTQEMEEEIITAPQLTSLGIGECILTIGGKYIYHLKLPVIQAIKEYPFILNRFNEDRPELGISLKLNYKKYIDITEIKKEMSLSDERNGLDLLDSEDEKQAKAKRMTQIKARFTKFLDLVVN